MFEFETTCVPCTIYKVIDFETPCNLQVREERQEQNGSQVDKEKTIQEVVEIMPQPSMVKMVELQADQISDASSILGVVRIKHNY